MTPRPLELVCPAGTPAALRTAVDAGAHAVYCGYADETNARNFPGLNFSRAEMVHGVAYAHGKGAKVLVAINTFPRAGAEDPWRRAVADAAAAGADAVILADLGLIAYARDHHPALRRHVSVQAAAANPDAIGFYVREFGVKRVVLPRVLSVADIAAINRRIDCETEVFVFGGLCVMAEGRCALSSYVTGQSPNMQGACSPASAVRYRRAGGMVESLLGGYVIDRAAPDEPAPYPTLCKGCFTSPSGTGTSTTGTSTTGHLFAEPASLDAAELIPALAAAGVTALKLEGRQRSRAYVARVVGTFRRAVDAHAAGDPVPAGQLEALSEGQSTTAGAYNKSWR